MTTAGSAVDPAPASGSGFGSESGTVFGPYGIGPQDLCLGLALLKKMEISL
ncbi:hypothetical protein [Streptomyces sp. NBC_00212]|uniref:hypothetical protein n=1 Tax=Streptomyces sp. NBC_00212 TaxID=2975684 RepID=UPI00324688A0